MKKSNLTAILSVTTITLFLIIGPAFGEDALYVDPDGNVGIGTTNPGEKLHVHNSATGSLTRTYSAYTMADFGESPDVNGFVTGLINYYGSPVAYVWNRESGSLHFGTSDTYRMTINTTGDVGIGDTTPDAELEVEKSQNGTTQVMATNTSTGSSAAACFTMASNGGYSYLYRTGTNYTGLDGYRADDTILLDYGGGDIYLTTGGTYYTGMSAGNGRIYNYQTYTSPISGRNVYVDSYGGLGYNSSSIRGKMNVVDMEDIDWLYDLRPVNYERKKVARQGIQDHKEYDSYFLEESTGIKEYGLIAEEVALVNPYLVFYDDTDGDGVEEFDEQPAGINESQLVAVLLKAVQEQHAELGILRAENQEIKSELCKKDSSYSFCKEDKR